VRPDHGALDRDWPFLNAEDYGFFAAVELRGDRRQPRAEIR
jgi:hypothetical protein